MIEERTNFNIIYRDGRLMVYTERFHCQEKVFDSTVENDDLRDVFDKILPKSRRFEKWKKELDDAVSKMTDEDWDELLKDNSVSCDICKGVGWIQPEGQNAKMLCWKCLN